MGVLGVEAGEESLDRWGFTEGGEEMAKCHCSDLAISGGSATCEKWTRFKPGIGAETGPVEPNECSTDVR
jgi:hypothetical protein